jgi:hypothetical protein
MFHVNQDLSLCLFALYMFEWAAEDGLFRVYRYGKIKTWGIVSQCSFLICSLPAVGQIAGNTSLLSYAKLVGGKLIEGNIICGEQLDKDGFALHLQVTSFFHLSAR